MLTPSPAPLRTFLVTIQFFSGGEPYASETYTVDAANWYLAEQHALQMSGSSVYDNARIPGLTRTAVACDTECSADRRP